MSMVNNAFVCDRCGADVGNGSVVNCIVVSDLDAERGMVVNLHFCRSRFDEEGKKVRGCDSYILTPKNTQSFGEKNGSYERPVLNEPEKEAPVEVIPPVDPAPTPETAKRSVKKRTTKKKAN